MKPQALMYVPVLGLWTLLKLPYSKWWRSALAAVVVAVVGVLPFQLGHPWYWIVELYHSTAAYYHETSVNAFNLMALMGGLRKPDYRHLRGSVVLQSRDGAARAAVRVYRMAALE